MKYEDIKGESTTVESQEHIVSTNYFYEKKNWILWCPKSDSFISI